MIQWNVGINSIKFCFPASSTFLNVEYIFCLYSEDIIYDIPVVTNKRAGKFLQ